MRKLSPPVCVCVHAVCIKHYHQHQQIILFFQLNIIILLIILYFSSSDSKPSSDITIKTELMTSMYRLSVTHSLNLCVVLHVFTHGFLYFDAFRIIKNISELFSWSDSPAVDFRYKPPIAFISHVSSPTVDCFWILNALI